MILESALKLREDLAKLEHEQWMHWTSHIKDEFGDELPEELTDRWEEKRMPYNELTEEEKDKDRKWADKIIDRVLAR
jgi:hypothetical protein